MRASRLIMLLLPPAYIIFWQYVLYERLIVPRLSEWNSVPAWIWVVSLGALAILVTTAGWTLSLRVRAAYAVGLSLLLLAFRALLAGNALGFLKLELTDVLSPWSLVFHAGCALVLFGLLSIAALWRARRTQPAGDS